MGSDIIVSWLPWVVMAIIFVALVYAGIKQVLPTPVMIGSSILFVIVMITLALNTPRPDEFFPEFIDTDPLRYWVDDGLNWVVKYWGEGFETAAYPLLLLLLNIEKILLAVPWWLLTVLFCGLAYLASRSLVLPILVFTGLMFMGLMELWEDSVRTMALMLAATITAIVVSIPTGIFMSRSARFRSFMSPILDLMQTMPSFVYLIPVVMIFGPGKVPALIATIIYAAPPLVRLTDLGLRMVDADVMEATRAFGTTPQQRLFGVQIPLALPTILAGVNQTTMMALAMVVIASMIGAGGLGYQVLQGIGRLEVSRGLFAGLGIVALAIIFDRVTQAFGKRLQSRIGLAEKQT